jgi:hypothetical protein
MTLEVYSSAPEETVDSGLPQLRTAAEWLIWMLPTEPAWGNDEVQSVLRAFHDLRGIAWFVSDGGAHTPAVKNHLRAFGSYKPDLAEKVIVERTLTYRSANDTLYSDIAWLDAGHGESLASFLSRTTSGADSTVSFIRPDDFAVAEWSKAVAGLEWLWLLGNNKLSASNSPLDADPILAAYVRLTVRSNGVAGLIFDVHGRSGLALFGDRKILETAANRITDVDWQPTKDVFHRWYRRGLHFRSAP